MLAAEANPEPKRRLTRVQQAVVDYCEQEYLAFGVLPDTASIYAFLAAYRTELRNEADFPDSPAALKVALRQDSGENDYTVVVALKKRGIEAAILVPGAGLTPEQLAAANVMLDFSDKRATKTKLNELGVSTHQWHAWKRNPNFAAYLRQRAESTLGNNIDAAHTALMSNIEQGDLNSIKLYLEMTGRWSSKTMGEVNIEFLMIRILEVLQIHIKDPKTLTAIASDLGDLTSAGKPTSLNPVPTEAPVAIGQTSTPEPVDWLNL